jgi:hypothetical protein
VIRIADLMERDLGEYIATKPIQAAYELLFSAMLAAIESPTGNVGIWISGFCGSGKSSFVKNLGRALANPQQVESGRIAESVQLLNRKAPYEIFLCAVTPRASITELMDQTLLRELDYAADPKIAALEIELEKKGKLAAFQDRCRAEYQQEWRDTRKNAGNLERTSTLLHRFDPMNFPAPDTWSHLVKNRPTARLNVPDLVERSFDLCEIRRPGKAFAFILDDAGKHLQDLAGIVAQFGKQGLARIKAGKIPAPVWIIVTCDGTLPETAQPLAATLASLPELQNHFQHRIDLSHAGIPEIAARRALRKKEGHAPVLRHLFQQYGPRLIENIRLERSSLSTDIDEDQFVRFYPYLPHRIELSVDIVSGIRRHLDAPEPCANRAIVEQCFEMLTSDRTRLGDQPVGALVSIDRIYDLLEDCIPPEKHQVIAEIARRFDADDEYPKLASRVAKALCLLEFAKTELPRTTGNIAALLVQQVAGAKPIAGVDASLFHLKEAEYVHGNHDGWQLYSWGEPRRAAADLEWLKNRVGSVNLRPPGWRNDLIQSVKKWWARLLTWYTRPLQEFTDSASRAAQGAAWAIDHLSRNKLDAEFASGNQVAMEQLSMDVVALKARLAQAENIIAALANSPPAPSELVHHADAHFDSTVGVRYHRTAYIIGLFGTGRRYINEIILLHIGERAKYFRDTIRLHPGPTPMIYSGHATILYPSRGQEPPVVMRRIIDAVRSGYADSIFVYRHPLDSLLTNWVWWRTYLRDNRWIAGISEVYENLDEFCAVLEHEFSEFKSFARGDPEFFTGLPGLPFLSFPEFVEETELHLQSARLALRLEDFTIDPAQQFAKIVEVMSADIDLRGLRIQPPRARRYGYRAVQEKVPAFKDFVHTLDAETRGRMERIGYPEGVTE